jgi:uncharacterized protein (TIGR02145 family)
MNKIKSHLEILIACAIIMVSFVNTLIAQNRNIIKDQDGNTYKTVRIGAQTWLAENLKTTKYRDGSTIALVTDEKSWSDRTSPGYCWYNNDSVTYKNKYGALYNWYTVATGNLCPAGWHVPCDAEWIVLETALGGSNIAGAKMKETGTAHWNSPNTDATNETGLTALPGGYRLDNGTFSCIGNYGFLWSSTEFLWGFDEYYTQYNWGRYLSYFLSNVYRYYFNKKYGFSVRCLSDTTPSVSTTTVSTYISHSANVGGHVSSDSNSPVTERGVFWGPSQNPEVSGTKLKIGDGKGSFLTKLSGLNPSTIYYVRAYAINGIGRAYGEQISFKTASSSTTVKDIEGNIYKIVTIGSQVWMAENLKTSKYNNGTSIPQITNPTLWNNLSTPAYCWYNNDTTFYKHTYGALYNWYTVNTGRLCPAGWHVPTDAEWTTLTDNLEGSSIAGAKLKESGSLHWIGTNTGATNESGFTALPGGLRDLEEFNDAGKTGGWWSSDEYKSVFALSRSLQSFENRVGLRYSDRKQIGLSIRCIKD